MYKRFTLIIAVFLIVVLGMTLTGCGKSSGPAGKNLKLGCLAISERMVQWIKEGLTPLGYNVEIVMFDANQLPAVALKDGNVDGIIANHRQWMQTFNKENNCNLEMVQPYLFRSFYAIYSLKYKKVADIPQNAQIVIPGDPTNLSRSLIILREAGLITLKDKTGHFYTVLDIKDNPKKIKLIEAEITHTARSIQDADAVIATAYHISAKTKIDPRDVVFEDPQNKDYPLGLIVRSEDVNSAWVKEAVKIYRSEQYRAKFNEVYKGQYFLFD
ncbi:MAG: D-methionine-binding lipoprotein MetQ precursor [Syntrophorhabdus sp. PtaU1.Bin058]|nr:MAG: D-methionine-binding lipoprotein MetQ precursor [Syntrophorhabdus sp. PtaU1.Bin058]